METPNPADDVKVQTVINFRGFILICEEKSVLAKIAETRGHV